MIARNVFFVDANIFVYAHQPQHEPVKQPLALYWIDRLMTDRSGRTSVQALNECYWALTRKARVPVPRDVAWAYVMTLMAWNPCAIDIDLVRRARELELRHGFSWWDCLILAAAQVQGCGTLLTEDLDDGGIYGGVRISNPFTLAVSDVA